ncbi:PIN domain-containing protein [Spartinivicinus ruber]|uniref:PIN domain-containing protein n=1 Tax=Spartinivicinus ruber TaxID=2683272 RepID=UPI0013D7758B|nr:PIN domain-containing protein [Spartinivicinus ruber]
MTVIAVLDANVLYPLKLRGMLLWVAYQNCFTPIWSTIILDEWTRNLKKNNPDIDVNKLEKSCRQVNQGFPYACVDEEEIEQFLSQVPQLPDKDDRHVVAAALASEALYLVTHNLKDFPNSVLKPLGLKALSPDNFFQLLIEKYPEEVYSGVEEARKRWKKPPFNQEALIAWMQKNKLKQLASFITQHSKLTL